MLGPCAAVRNFNKSPPINGTHYTYPGINQNFSRNFWILTSIIISHSHYKSNSISQWYETSLVHFGFSLPNLVDKTSLLTFPTRLSVHSLTASRCRILRRKHSACVENKCTLWTHESIHELVPLSRHFHTIASRHKSIMLFDISQSIVTYWLHINFVFYDLFGESRKLTVILRTQWNDHHMPALIYLSATLAGIDIRLRHICFTISPAHHMIRWLRNQSHVSTPRGCGEELQWLEYWTCYRTQRWGPGHLARGLVCDIPPGHPTLELHYTS